MSLPLSGRYVGLLLLPLLVACQPDKPTQQPSASPTARQLPAEKPASAPFRRWRRYTGQVGSYPVVVELSFEDTAMVGSYYYARHGELVPLRAQPPGPGQALRLREGTAETSSGNWEAVQPAGPVLSGTWRSPDGRRQLPFSLREEYAGAVRYEQVGFSREGQLPADSAVCGIPGRTVKFSLQGVQLLDAGSSPALQRIQQQLLPVPPAQLEAYVARQVADNVGDCTETEKSAWVSYNADHLLSVTSLEVEFAFGAPHPTHHFTSMTFDLRTGSRLRLADLLRPGYEQPLRQLLTNRLLADPGYGDFYRGEQAEGQQRWLNQAGRPQQLVPLPAEGVALTPAGLEFTWNEYTIAPYVMGPQSVELSYADLRRLVRPSGPLAAVVARHK